LARFDPGGVMTSPAALVLEHGLELEQLLAAGMRSLPALASELDLTDDETVELAQELLNRGRLQIAPLGGSE